MAHATEDMIKSILDKFSRIDYIRPSELPDIDLYMDQVTTFMERRLQDKKRYESDKILTKTMINNYAKNDLLPPPAKKKYSKDHMLLLVFIYYFKSILSISDIQKILGPISEKYFGKDQDLDLESLYDEVFSLEAGEIEAVKNDILAKFDRSKETFPDVSPDEAEYLQLFSFICMLSFDVYVKKQLIEKIIDESFSE
jgi:hypothetical protein